MSNLKGNLESISLMDVAQLLHVNRKTGQLHIQSGKSSGTLFFMNGEVIHAECGLYKGESAAFEILDLNTGTFDFHAGSVQSPHSIRRSLTDLLMEAARIGDSRRRLHTFFPHMDAVPWPTLPSDQLVTGLKIFEEERRIIPFFDGYRDFREIMDASGQHDVAVLQAAAILKEAGRLEVLEPDVSLAVTTLKTGFFKKGDHIELSKSLETKWMGMGPHSRGIQNLRVIWPKGPAIEPVKFVADLPDRVVAIPREFMEAWELAEGSPVKVRPAP
ncbi:MAG TPA: DUF4388 domain-containing protein [Holophagaceae bacterium]|nr:DUF4388 domain-containing protein [Holophagaceae bacterium]